MGVTYEGSVTEKVRSAIAKNRITEKGGPLKEESYCKIRNMVEIIRKNRRRGADDSLCWGALVESLLYINLSSTTFAEGTHFSFPHSEGAA